MKKPEISQFTGGNVKQCSCFGKQSRSYSKSQYRVTVRSNSPAPCYIPKRIKNMYSHKNLDMNVHGLLFIIAQSGNSPSKKVNSSKVEGSITL